MTLPQHEIKAEDCHEGGDDEEGGPAVHASQAPSDSEYQDLEDIEEHDPESHPFFLVF